MEIRGNRARLQCWVMPEQARWIEETAKRLNVSQSDIVRLCVSRGQGELSALDKSFVGKPENVRAAMDFFKRMSGGIENVGQLDFT